MTAKQTVLEKYPHSNCRSYDTQLTRREKSRLYIVYSLPFTQSPIVLGQANTAIGAWKKAKENLYENTK